MPRRPRVRALHRARLAAWRDESLTLAHKRRKRAEQVANRMQKATAMSPQTTQALSSGWIFLWTEPCALDPWTPGGPAV